MQACEKWPGNMSFSMMTGFPYTQREQLTSFTTSASSSERSCCASEVHLELSAEEQTPTWEDAEGHRLYMCEFPCHSLP